MESVVLVALIGVAGTLGASILGAHFTRKNAVAIAEHSARLAREQEREREARAAARERLLRQFEARALVERVFKQHIRTGNSWETAEHRDEAIRVSGIVAAAFGSAEFGRAILDHLLAHAMSWSFSPPDSRPYGPPTLQRYFDQHDAEMWRVIRETEAAAGTALAARPTPPAQPEITTTLA